MDITRRMRNADMSFVERTARPNSDDGSGIPDLSDLLVQLSNRASELDVMCDSKAKSYDRSLNKGETPKGLEDSWAIRDRMVLVTKALWQIDGIFDKVSRM